MAALLQGYATHGRPPEGDCKPPQAADFAATHASASSRVSNTWATSPAALMKSVVGERNQSLRRGSTQQGPAPHGSYPHPAKVQGPDFASIRRRALRAGVADRVQHVPNRGHGSSGETPNSAILADQDEGALAGIRIGAVLRPAVLVAFTDRASLLQHEIAQPRSGYRLASAAAEIEMDK